MKRLVRIAQDYYGEQNFYQIAFYETEGQLSCSNTLPNNHLKSEENYLNFRKDFDFISSNHSPNFLEAFLEKYISLLSNDEQEKYSIFQNSYRNKMLFINVVTTLLTRTLFHFSHSTSKKAHELLNLFFLKLPFLGYDSAIRNDDVSQDIIGLLRSHYLFESHLQNAKSYQLKK